MVMRAYSLTTLTTTNVFTWAASCEILAGCLHMFSQPCFNFHPWAILHFVSWAIRLVNSQWPKSICYRLLHSFSKVFRGRYNKMMVQSLMQQWGPGENVSPPGSEREVKPGDGSLLRRPCHCQCRYSAWQISGLPCIIFRWSFALSTAFILTATQCQSSFGSNIRRSTRR